MYCENYSYKVTEATFRKLTGAPRVAGLPQFMIISGDGEDFFTAKFVKVPPGKRSQKTMERSTLLLMGKSIILTGPCSIAFCMFTRG